jgi:ABC-type phosphate transport system permease subunit
MIMKVYLFTLFVILIIYFFFFFLDCRRIPHPSDNGVDICTFSVNANWRPSNKTEAMTDTVMGGTLVGTAGTVSATQIGVEYYYE